MMTDNPLELDNVPYYTPSSVDEEHASVKIHADVLSIYWPDRYRFTKKDMLLSKKIIFSKRNENDNTTTLYDVLLFIKNGFEALGLEVRSIEGYGYEAGDRELVYNLEGVERDGSNKCYRFHIRT